MMYSFFFFTFLSKLLIIFEFILGMHHLVEAQSSFYYTNLKCISDDKSLQNCVGAHRIVMIIIGTFSACIYNYNYYHNDAHCRIERSYS